MANEVTLRITSQPDGFYWLAKAEGQIFVQSYVAYVSLDAAYRDAVDIMERLGFSRDEIALITF